MQAVLENAGYDVLTIDAASAYDVIEQDPPQLVIVATTFAFREEGWALVQRMQRNEDTAPIPVIVLGSADQEPITARFPQPPDNVRLLFTPFDAAALVKAVRESIERFD
jgi:CheY-like chemotaxis protein